MILFFSLIVIETIYKEKHFIIYYIIIIHFHLSLIPCYSLILSVLMFLKVLILKITTQKKF